MFEGVLAQLQPPETSVMPNFDLFASRLKNLVSNGIVNTSASSMFWQKKRVDISTLYSIFCIPVGGREKKPAISKISSRITC